MMLDGAVFCNARTGQMFYLERRYDSSAMLTHIREIKVMQSPNSIGRAMLQGSR